MAKNFKKLKAIQTYHRSSKVFLRQKKSRSDFFWHRPGGQAGADVPPVDVRPELAGTANAELAGTANAELAGTANEVYLRRHNAKKCKILLRN